MGGRRCPRAPVPRGGPAPTFLCCRKSQLSQASKRTRSLIPEGRAAASRLRAALKAHFGGHSEALVEFGVVPVRKRRAPQPADPPPVKVAVPSVSE